MKTTTHVRKAFAEIVNAVDRKLDKAVLNVIIAQLNLVYAQGKMAGIELSFRKIK